MDNNDDDNNELGFDAQSYYSNSGYNSNYSIDNYFNACNEQRKAINSNQDNSLKQKETKTKKRIITKEIISKKIVIKAIVIGVLTIVIIFGIYMLFINKQNITILN